MHACRHKPSSILFICLVMAGITCSAVFGQSASTFPANKHDGMQVLPTKPPMVVEERSKQELSVAPSPQDSLRSPFVEQRIASSTGITDVLALTTFAITATGFVVTLLSGITAGYSFLAVRRSKAAAKKLSKSFDDHAFKLQEQSNSLHLRYSKILEIRHIYWSVLTDSTPESNVDTGFLTANPMEIYVSHQKALTELECALLRLENDQSETVCSALNAISNYSAPIQLAQKLADYIKLLIRQGIFQKPALDADREEVERRLADTLQNLGA